MTLLQSIETAIALYGKDLKKEVKETKKRLISYQKDIWLLNLLEKNETLKTDNATLTLRKQLNQLENATNYLKTYPNTDTKTYYELIYYRYLYPHSLNKDALMKRLFIEERTYYRKKKEALSLLALVLTLDED